jgi:hypothetical protein
MPPSSTGNPGERKPRDLQSTDLFLEMFFDSSPVERSAVLFRLSHTAALKTMDAEFMQ